MLSDHKTETDTSSYVSASWGSQLSRRGFLKTSAATLAGLAASAYFHEAMAAPLLPWQTTDDLVLSSLDKAYLFQDTMMDLYFQGSTLRLVQSFVPTKKFNPHDAATTYANALTIIAFLERGQSDDITRATVLGDSLVYGQSHDPVYSDGRLRDGYHANPYVLQNGFVNVQAGGSDTGNMAWPGLALAHLYKQTNTQSYLTGAMQLGTWIQTNCYDTRGTGGYIAGLDSSQTKLLYKSVEHNIDVYTLFTFLAQLTNDNTWLADAQHALTFIQSMWNSTGSFFWTGTLADGVTINKIAIPEDVQSWSYLTLLDNTYAASIDWAYTHLAAKDKKFSGVCFSNADRTGVWFEGTGHMACALFARNASGDVQKANTFLADIALAQSQGPHTDHKGIIAASHDGLRTGFGPMYYAALNIGATSFYCMASQMGNPFKL